MVVEAVTIGFLAVMLGTALLGVVDRFLFGMGLAWTEELARFCLIWTSLLAAAVAARRGGHFRVEVLAARLGRWGQIATGVVGIAALAIVIYYGVRLAYVFHQQTSPALGIPMSWVYVAAPVCATLIAGYLVRDLYVALRRPPPPEA